MSLGAQLGGHMDDELTKVLSMRIAGAFAGVGVECIPAIEKYLREADVPREVSYGCRVRFWIDKEEHLRAQLVPSQPKLPTVQLDKVDFTLAWQDNQLVFDYIGAPEKPKPVETQPARGANGSDPAPPTTHEPIPDATGRCDALERTGHHDWMPMDSSPGVFMCACGQRGRMSSPAPEATQ